MLDFCPIKTRPPRGSMASKPPSSSQSTLAPSPAPVQLEAEVDERSSYLEVEEPSKNEILFGGNSCANEIRTFGTCPLPVSTSGLPGAGVRAYPGVSPAIKLLETCWNSSCAPTCASQTRICLCNGRAACAHSLLVA